MTLRLASLNIERDLHAHRFIPFFKEWRPDVLCLQELPDNLIRPVAEQLGLPHHAYAPLLRHPHSAFVMGQGLYSRHPLANIRLIPYAGGGSGYETHDSTSVDTKAATSRFQVLAADVMGGGQTCTVATTHFPWTPNGRSDPIQRAAVEALIAAMAPLGDFVLTGDFNAPRGGDIFTRLAAAWTGNIPARYPTSIDGNLHKAGPLPYMVDGLFTTPGYKASEVELHGGLSDHMGITALITRVQG
jgi:endonuclease/exonuclease/phosphatase family metal-dependent hydrolase